MFRRSPQQISTRRVRADRRLPARRAGLGAVAVLCVAFLLIGASCTGGDDAAVPTATSHTAFTLAPEMAAEEIPSVTVPEGFVLKDARGVTVARFPSKPKGASTPPLPVLGGGAQIDGTVTGPEGPVPGASVLLERVVGDRMGQLTIATGPDGRYVAKGIHGGKYRIRAWKAPTLASRASALAYVADIDGRATVDLTVEAFTGRSLQLGLDITALNVGDTAHVRALLTDQVVGDDGIVIGQGIASAEIRLSASGSMTFGNPLATTNGQGGATWEVTCTKEGTTAFTATTEGASDAFTSPNCGPRPTTTTTTVDVPDFPVGQEFDVPHKGVLPAGTYTTFLDGCKTSYEFYANGEWQRERFTVAGPTMSLAGPARDFKAADGTKGCTYRRKS